MEKYSLLKLTGFTNGQLGHILINELGFKGSAPDPKASNYRMRMIDIICDIQDGKKPANSSFVVADHFTLNNTAIKFAFIGKDFKSHFLNKIEKETVRPQHFITKLSRRVRDSEIVVYVGGEVQAEVNLSGIYELLKLQPRGEEGNLLTDGMTNIFYVRDTNSNSLCPINVTWDAGWTVYISQFDDPVGRKAGNRVFYK